MIAPSRLIRSFARAGKRSIVNSRISENCSTELLDVSRIALNKIELHQELTNLNEIAGRFRGRYGSSMEQARLTLKPSISSEPIIIHGDPVRLGQVVTNLIINAIKFNNPGGFIELTTLRDQNEAVIRVSDSGVGISPEMLGQIFDLFSQAEQGLDRSRGGLGIGLTLARRLMELHGGTLISRSQGVGHGSEFEARLPLAADGQLPAQAQLQNAPVLAGQQASPLRILVADDNRDAAESLSLCLRQEGHDVTVVHDGHSALEVACGDKPDVVILDIGLPRMNGYEVAKQLRQKLKVALIAVSGYARDENTEVEFDHYLIKPARPADLLTLISQVNRSETEDRTDNSDPRT